MGRRRPPDGYLAALCGLLLAASTTAMAGGGEPAAPLAPSTPAPMIRGGSACPPPDAVWSELLTLLPADRLAARMRARSTDQAPLTIDDRGPSFRVDVAGQAREYADAARDCAHRAKAAALFAALVLDPAAALSAGATPAPESVPPPPPAPALAAAAAPPAPGATPAASLPRPFARVGVAPLIAAGFSGSGHSTQAGGSLEITLGRHALALLIGGSAVAPADTDVAGVKVRQWRATAKVGGRARRAFRGAEIYGDASLGVGLVSESGAGLAQPEQARGLEFGLHVGVGVRPWADARWSPFCELAHELVPWPSSIFALPRGELGHAPFSWLGIKAGVSLGL